MGLEDFIKRTGIGRKQTITLIRVGAFRFTGLSKKELLWKIHLLTDTIVKLVGGLELFQVESKNYQLPVLVNTALENAYHELELLGFPLSMFLFDLLETEYRGEINASDLSNHIGQVVKMVGQYVCEKTVHTKLGQNMWFGTFLDPEGNFFDTTHFPNTTPSYPFRGAGCYLIMGKVVEDFGFPSIEVIKFGKLPIRGNPVME
jgi:DNA polymerase-3 subunit alpha